jgi:hypothetical protein
LLLAIAAARATSTWQCHDPQRAVALCFREATMQHRAGFSLGVVSLTAAALAVAALAPSSAFARSQHRAHVSTQRAPIIEDRGYRVYGAGPSSAYGAMPGSGSSYPGFGYGYSDNSHGCSACN